MDKEWYNYFISLVKTLVRMKYYELKFLISGKGDIICRKLSESVSLRKKWQKDRGGVDGLGCVLGGGGRGMHSCVLIHLI